MNLTNILIVVVRYFGGIKLGASNLAKAYKQASMEALDNAEIIERTITEDIRFSFDFSVMANVNKFLKDNRFDKSSYSYTATNEILLKVNKDNKENILNQLSSIFGINIL